LTSNCQDARILPFENFRKQVRIEKGLLHDYGRLRVKSARIFAILSIDSISASLNPS
jgi:hypothetical protein